MKLDWYEASKWAREANRGKCEHEEPVWSWDCNFKLDFDGPLVDVSSRFYPPTSEEPGWGGKVTINVRGDCVIERRFEAETLDLLKQEVEDYVSACSTKARDWLSRGGLD